MLNLDPVSLISCLLSGALMIQVSGGTVQLYAFTETLCGQLFFSSITEDALVPQHRCLLKKREADSLSLQQSHYVGMLLVALVVEASVSLCIHPLGTSSHVWNSKKFPLTLFFFSPIIIITGVFYLPGWYG